MWRYTELCHQKKPNKKTKNIHTHKNLTQNVKASINEGSFVSLYGSTQRLSWGTVSFSLSLHINQENFHMLYHFREQNLNRKNQKLICGTLYAWNFWPASCNIFFFILRDSLKWFRMEKFEANWCHLNSPEPANANLKTYIWATASENHSQSACIHLQGRQLWHRNTFSIGATLEWKNLLSLEHKLFPVKSSPTIKAIYLPVEEINAILL